MKTEIEQAKETLRKAGYFVNNLWTVRDVTDKYKCTEEQAQSILKGVLENEWIVGEIHASIRELASQKGFIEIND